VHFGAKRREKRVSVGGEASSEYGRRGGNGWSDVRMGKHSTRFVRTEYSRWLRSIIVGLMIREATVVMRLPCVIVQGSEMW
jgi:hypothetical protein